MMHKLTLIFALLWSSHSTLAATIKDHYFTNRDGLHMHYLEAGSGNDTIVFIPGWLMPADIFRLQLEGLSEEFRVLAFDPRSQGKSEIFKGSHSVARRMDDMEDFLAAAKVHEYVLAGWSLGVLESLDFIERKPQTGLRGLIIIDNSIGEGSPPRARANSFYKDMSNTARRKKYLTNFTKGMFKTNIHQDIADAALQSALQMPGPAAIKLISQPYPRTYWRDIVAKQEVPVMYAIRPHLREQGEALLQRKGALAQIEVFDEAGHALFVDEPERFNTLTAAFVKRCFISLPAQASDPRPLPGEYGGLSASSASPSSSGN